jgi:hypothetical protein
MRSMIFAALVAATTISVASAEDLSTQAPPPSPPASRSPTTVTGDKLPGISPQQEAAIRYHPCTQAVGWANGRLRCNNRY